MKYWNAFIVPIIYFIFQLGILFLEASVIFFKFSKIAFQNLILRIQLGKGISDN